MSKSTLWLLEGNPYRDESERIGYLQNPKKRKIFERDNTKTLGATPNDSFPVALVWEHEYESKQPEINPQNIYVQAILDQSVIDKIVGQLLTHIDATYADKDQREAQKKIVRRLVWDFNNELTETYRTHFRFIDAKIQQQI